MTEQPIRVLCMNGESDQAETGSFIEMHRMGIDITVLTWPDSVNQRWLVESGVKTIPYYLKGKLSRPCIRFIRKELEANSYDVLHMLDKRATMNGLWASRGIDIKLVAYRGIVGNVSYFDPLSWMYLLNPRLDRIICVAEAIRQYLLGLRFLGLQIRREVPVTINKGHNPDWYQPPFEPLDQFGIPDDAFVVACTARGVPRKGVPVLLQAIHELPPGLNIHFLLSGTHMDNPQHQKLVEENQYADNIHLYGFLKRVPWILPNCHVSVLPSLRREGLPRGIIEAMIGGAVPIVTDSGGSPELVEHGHSGYVVPPGEADPIREAIMAMYEDRELHGRLAHGAQERIRNDFTVERTAAETIALYKELLGR